ncbi:MAG TPA: tetratricopeptide repeat protein [Candidatus Acidoferrales bacterium]
MVGRAQFHLHSSRRLSMSLVFLAAASLLAVSPVWAQQRRPATDPPPATFTLRGTVRLAINEAGLEMVRVDLKRFTGETVSTRFTRVNGEFEFTGLSRGRYQIVVAERGYVASQEEIEIHNSSRAGVVVYLRKADPEFGVPTGNTVSAREAALPKKARESFEKGMEQVHEKQDLRASVPHFQRAVQEATDYYEAWYQLGLVYLDLKQVPDAEQALDRAIETSEGRFADPLFALASLRSNQQRFADAETLAQRGLDAGTRGSGTVWQGYFELARAQYGLGRVEEAEKNLTEARSRREGYAPFHLLAANICIRKKDYVNLLAELEAYLKLEPAGPMSDGVRKTRDQVKAALARQQGSPPPQH